MIYADSLKEHVKIGALDTMITVRSEAVTTRNDLDEITAVTNTDTDVWAHVMNNDKDEADVNDKQTVIEHRTFIIRYRTLTYSHKIIHNSASYDIIGIEEIGRRRFLKVRTKRVV